MPVLVRYCTASDTSYAGIPIVPVNLGSSICPSPHVTFSNSTALVVASNPGGPSFFNVNNYSNLPLLVPAGALSAAYRVYYLRYIRVFLKLKYNNTLILELLCLFNKLNSKLYKYYLPDYINTEYTILSSLLLGDESRDPELNRGGIIAACKAIDQIYRLAKSAAPTTTLEIATTGDLGFKISYREEFIKADLDTLIVDSAKSRIKELNTIIREFAQKAIFKAIISITRGKRSLPSSSKIASDLDTPGPSLKKKARGISYYTRSAARAALVNLGKELDKVVPVLDVLEAPETSGENAGEIEVEVVEEAEF
ncbi:uncharacterized protein RSE6_13029 [Rhynchosporium secalis]|uniref:Uncharacterized protein n=1 Tax=Rhynchosporium secalis TaxID=38038 RepID=A0A1E1MRY5_RHYSE|nr:uncharacterized protein RSE6_13029 [Rhynchosporium secalis]